MTLLLSIDSGKRSGYAYFRDGILTSAGTFDGDKIFTPPGGRMSDLRNVAVAVELPVHRTGSGGVPPDDLIKLASRAGRAAGVCSAYGCLQPVRYVLPHAWKGQLPKDISHRRIAQTLKDREIPVWAALASLDGRDAVGIGLWILQRLQGG